MRSLLERKELPHAPIGLPEMDPLVEDGALAEAQLVSVVVDSLRSRGALLFDLRTALAFREANVAVLVVRGMQGLQWKQEPRDTQTTAWNVVGSQPQRYGNLFLLTLDFYPNARLSVSASQATFYAGLVSTLPSTPPDFTHADEETIRKGWPDWDSLIQLLQRASVGPR